MDGADVLQKTALFDWHVEHGGRMVDFAGWELPVFYETGAIAEHHATRASVGMFDIDHMGQVELSGPDAVAVVDSLVTSDITEVATGAAKYGLMCREDGGVIDDVIVYRTDDSTFMIVVNAANRLTDHVWIVAHADGHDVAVHDRSDELEMIAVQGPSAVALVDTAAGGGVASLNRFTSGMIEVFGTSALVGRTGYTGEDGVELYVHGGVEEVWAGLLTLAAERNIEALPIGLSARDSLRFEPGYPLYGHELGLEINPFEARLSWAVDLDGNDFIGRSSLVRIADVGVDRRLETLVMSEKGVPREGSTVVDSDGIELGVVVSGMFAPTVDVFAANAFLPRSHGVVGTDLFVDIRGRAKAATVVKRPLYRLSI